jgi:hypothetical protein
MMMISDEEEQQGGEVRFDSSCILRGDGLISFDAFSKFRKSNDDVNMCGPPFVSEPPILPANSMQLLTPLLSASQPSKTALFIAQEMTKTKELQLSLSGASHSTVSWQLH